MVSINLFKLRTKEVKGIFLQLFLVMLYECLFFVACRHRPYHVESTGSRLITEVKQRRARLVLGWMTAWEHRVLLATFSFLFLEAFIIFRVFFFVFCLTVELLMYFNLIKIN